MVLHSVGVMVETFKLLNVIDRSFGPETPSKACFENTDRTVSTALTDGCLMDYLLTVLCRQLYNCFLHCCQLLHLFLYLTSVLNILYHTVNLRTPILSIPRSYSPTVPRIF